MDTERCIRYMTRSAAIAVIVSRMIGGNCFAQTSFAPGNAAPSLEGGVWLKGKPITRFEPGYVYVLDFSSVLCSPCRAFIPHLTELAHRYAGRVVVAGVYVYENPEDDTLSTRYQEGVRRFISRMGAQMGYSVVVDGPARPLARTWMQAGNYQGMPTTFVVDQTGHMVWAGYPPGLESVLGRVLAGNFTIPEGLEIDRRRTSADVRIYREKKNANFKTAMAIVDSLIRIAPADKYMYFEKFRILLTTDEMSAYAFARWAAAQPCVHSEPVLFYIAREIVIDAHTLCRPDYKLALRLTDQAIDLSRSDVVTALLYDTKAQIYLSLGKMRKAVKAEKKAVSAVPLDTYPTMNYLWTAFNTRVQLFQQYGRIF